MAVANNVKFPQDLEYNSENKALSDSDIKLRIEAGIKITNRVSVFYSYVQGKSYKRTFYMRSFKLGNNKTLEKTIGFDEKGDEVYFSRQHLEALTIIRLRELLKSRNLKTSGNKKCLIDRMILDQNLPEQ